MPWGVINEVSRYFGVSPKLVTGPRRHAHLFRARTVVVRILRDELELSWPRIGHYLGGRHHQTIMHAYRRSLQMEEVDPIYCKEMEFICKMLELGASSPTTAIH